LARLDEQLKEDGFHGPGSMVILTPPVEARLNRQEKVSKRERELFDRFKCQWFDERMAVYHLHTADAEESPLESLTHAVVRRGFVESVTLTTAAFMDEGGRCEKCQGTGKILAHPITCPDCGGSGTRPGVAEAIFRAHPVTSVVLSDRRPLHMSGNYYWFNAADADASGYHPQSDVPKVLYSLLAENDRWVQGYSTAQTARAALSAACVAYGREKAGLEAVCV
jgi:hypothetical protein